MPLAPLGGKGVDVVVVADLSRSMPADSRARALEIVRLLESARATGDRVGIVTYGREARIERLPEEFGEVGAFVQEVDRDGSDLGGAIALAASLIPRERPGASDRAVGRRGERRAGGGGGARGGGARAADRLSRASAAARRRTSPSNRSICPGTVDEREPFQFTASVRTDRTVESEAVLLRDGVEIARTTRTFQPGATQLTFRDLIDRPGVARYRLELTAERRPRAREQRRRRRRARRGAGDDPARQRQRRRPTT